MLHCTQLQDNVWFSMQVKLNPRLLHLTLPFKCRLYPVWNWSCKTLRRARFVYEGLNTGTPRETRYELITQTDLYKKNINRFINNNLIRENINIDVLYEVGSYVSLQMSSEDIICILSPLFIAHLDGAQRKVQIRIPVYYIVLHQCCESNNTITNSR